MFRLSPFDHVAAAGSDLSGDTTPCRMTEVTLHSHARFKETYALMSSSVSDGRVAAAGDAERRVQEDAGLINLVRPPC